MDTIAKCPLGENGSHLWECPDGHNRTLTTRLTPGGNPCISALLDLTNGLGPDVVIEAVGLPQTFRAAVEEVTFTGRVVYIGYAKEPIAYETWLFVQKELDILGSRNALQEDFRRVIDMLEDRRFPVDEVVSAMIRIEEGPDFLRAWSENPSRFSKIMIYTD